jgi:putative transposase
VIVELRTIAEATRVARATGGIHLPGKVKGKLSRRVDVGPDFETHRSAVEEVSLLFSLFKPSVDGDLVKVPSGWTVTGTSFEVEWPKDSSVVKSHFGGRRKAYNWARSQVAADMDAQKLDPTHVSVPWTTGALRKEWNRVKDEVAPWWAENSKETYSSGIDDLVQALTNWSKSHSGQRRGRKVGFPRFKSARKDNNRVRFTTGTMRLDGDRRTITLPVIGDLRSKENTRRVQRPVAQGRARILNMTLSERWGRLFVSMNYVIRTQQRQPVTKPGVRAAVDLGLRVLATTADTDGNITRYENPAPLRATLNERRRVGRQMSRCIPGSRGHRAAKAKLARLDRRAVHLRRETWHKLTTEMTATYSEIVVEDLDLAAMKRSMGRRAFRRSVSDAALGMARPMFVYKAGRTGSVLTVADRWFPSSQIHHGCGCRLVAPTKLAKLLVCQETGELVDRDINAALNLRDWPDTASSGPVGTTAPNVSSLASGGGDVGSDTGITGAGGATVRLGIKPEPVAVRPEPMEAPGLPEEPRERGAA